MSTKLGKHAGLRHDILGYGIMGACYQAPHATPGQRPMETFLSLTIFSFHHYPHCHMSLHMHKTTSTLVKMC